MVPWAIPVAEQKAEEDTRLAVELASASAAQVHAEDGTIQFDDTSEFVRSIAIPQAPVVKVIQISTAPEASSSSSSAVKAEEEDVDLNALVGDVDMEGGDEQEEEEGDDLLGETALRLGLSIEEMRIKADKDLQEAEAAEELAVSRSLPFSSLLSLVSSFASGLSTDPASILHPFLQARNRSRSLPRTRSGRSTRDAQVNRKHRLLRPSNHRTRASPEGEGHVARRCSSTNCQAPSREDPSPRRKQGSGDEGVRDRKSVV